jgi:hypothetical protein
VADPAFAFDFRGLVLSEAGSVMAMKHSLEKLAVAHRAADLNLALPEEQLGKQAQRAATKARKQVTKAYKTQLASTFELLTAQRPANFATNDILRELMVQRQLHSNCASCSASCSFVACRILLHPVMATAANIHRAYLQYEALDLAELPHIAARVAICDLTLLHLQAAIAASAQDGDVALPLDEARRDVILKRLQKSAKLWDDKIEWCLTQNTELVDKLINRPPGK